MTLNGNFKGASHGRPAATSHGTNATYVDVTIRNPADLESSWTGKFLVDAGVFDSFVPGSLLEEIGLKPRGCREYVFADGKSVALDITIAEIEFKEGGGWRDCCVRRGRDRAIARYDRFGSRADSRWTV